VDINYEQKRGTVSKNYVNASRKAARSAEIADDGAKAARASQKDNIESGIKAARQSGKVIMPDGYNILKKFSNKSTIEV